MTDPDVAESSPASGADGRVDRNQARPTDTDRSGGRRPWTLRYVAETGSTNADLLELGRAGAADRTVLRTDHQTAGRGRLDRRWTSPPGSNLMVSLLFRAAPDDPTELTRRVSVAAVEAVLATTDRRAGLKWPNDLLLDGRKLAGILAQRDEVTGAVVVGLGLNTSWSPDDATDLGGVVTPAALLDALLEAYDRLPVDAAAFHGVYRNNLVTLGQRVRVELPDAEVSGRAVDVDVNGHLVVVDDCALAHHLSVGDVVHLRPAVD